jgi:hypothetical protein
MTTPPDFGGRDIEEGLEEDLGGPRAEHDQIDHHDEYNTVWGSNEAHAPGQVCARCGAVIAVGQDVRRRADGTWTHEICPVPA